ncbi:MAG: DISARM system helicase DrmA [Thermoflexales bacterium]|nr:DISARM system helicase DrmA [Thermoflexales bacterium]MDW8352656.1 DISARM system helicase DrmA [Anaerolineae bacterium]
MTNILHPPSPAELRDKLREAVARDLLGPAGGDEEIVDEVAVRGRYVLGLLAPKGQTPLPVGDGSDDEDDTVGHDAPEERIELALGGSDSEEGSPEAARPKAVGMLPSSIGLTFTLAPEAKAIRVVARWGRYRRISREEAGLGEGKHNPWRRTQVEGRSGDIPLRAGRISRWTPDAASPDVYVDGRIRRYNHGWTVTLYLVNGQREPRMNKDEAWVFQPELIVTALDAHGTEAPLFRRVLARAEVTSRLPSEEQQIRMAHRKQVEFAVGHGVAVHAERAPGCFDAAVRLRTTVMPAFEVGPTLPEPVAGAQLEMRALSEMPDADFGAALKPLLDAYAEWIEARRREVDHPAPDLQPFLDAARACLDACREALERMRAGVAVISTNRQAAEAFRFANRAMWMQRLHTEYAQAMRKAGGEAPRLPFDQFKPAREPAWRPFQLAFILINLPSLVDPLHPERNAIADVLWFPTGGGKTEAYLGLTAFTLAMRRLQGQMGKYDGSAGVAVLMRYTLRLLTLQQFQRAAALICACEELRRADPARWGEETFRIGLWVGQASTPNTTEESDNMVRELRNGGYIAGSTPHQLTTCPYCGHEINPGRDIEVETYAQGRARTLIYCGDPNGECLFSRRRSPGEGLPVLVVDEEIYRRLPALLIATVDKFAQLPWKGETQMLFGRVNGYCPRHGFRSPEIKDADSHPPTRDKRLPAVKTQPRGPLRPPDLIIQDELHLINGPLGTLVGLYETAVDALASWSLEGQTVKPKIIASSATIRRADAQVSALYTRQARIFPPPGLDAGDSFFARQRAPSAEHPGRLYVGVCAPGRQMRALLIRLYQACLAAAQHLFNQYGSLVDPWMTLVGYFNSLRELGGMRRAIDDAVAVRLRQMNRRGLAGRFIQQYGIEELTSRKSAADIPNTLDRLEIPFVAGAAGGDGGAAPGRGTLGPIDVLLATNMISVGVDVPRLGLMAVANQPKNTAEYIQATSRIGRACPGLVFTAYNWARPRDLSHYERFEHYHASFYQHVEALSVTPFSPRALDRGVSALLVSLIRLAGDDFNANDRAAALDLNHPLVVRACEQITRRALDVTGKQTVEVLVKQMLQHALKTWLREAQTASSGGARLGYKADFDGRTRNLLKPAEAQLGSGWHIFTCLNSLRDVEPSVNLVLYEDNHAADELPPA